MKSEHRTATEIWKHRVPELKRDEADAGKVRKGGERRMFSLRPPFVSSRQRNGVAG